MKRILIIQGSPRNIESCSNMWGKTRILIKYAVQNFPYKDLVKFDYLDLSINQKGKNSKPIIQPCKACYSTAGGYHCHWPCSCYAKGQNDLMYENNVYDKFKKCDGFILYTPINWYSAPTQVKAMFDRLICANLTLDEEFIESKLGIDNIKKAKYTRPLSESHKYDAQLKNHLEGKFGAFFIHGDGGADDYTDRKFPDSFITSKKLDKIISSPKFAIMPIVNQCRYSGIYVPNELIETHIEGKNKTYSKNNSDFKNNTEFLNKGLQILIKLFEQI